MSFIVTEISDHVDTDSFHCQNEKVNEFINKYAFYNNQNLLSKVYVLIDEKTESIAGVISLSANRINLPHSKK